MLKLNELIDYAGTYPEIGKQIRFYGKAKEVLHVPGTCWHFVKLGMKTMLIGHYDQIEEIEDRKQLLVMMKKVPSCKEYDIVAHDIRPFGVEKKECVYLSTELKNISKIWHNFYVSENENKVFYIVVG